MTHTHTTEPRHAKHVAPTDSPSDHVRVSPQGKGIEWLRDLMDIDHALWVLPLSIFFIELVFKVGTTGGFFPHVFFIALFSVVGGEVVYLLSSISRSERTNRIVRSGLLAAVGVVFAVEYFVYRMFKVFYDLNTVTNGAGHAGGQFGWQIAWLVLNPLGLTMIALLLAPAIVLWFAGRQPAGDSDASGEGAHHPRRLKQVTQTGIAGALRRIRRWFLGTRDRLRGLQLSERLVPPARTATTKQRVCAVACAVVAHALALILVSFSGSFGRVYTDRYNFQSSVENFGLSVSLRKEVANRLFGTSKGVTFTNTEHSMPRVSDGESGDEAADEEAVDYGLSVSDIDFEALADSAYDDTWAALDRYVAQQTPSSKNAMSGRFEGYNLIFISAEAFSAEAIREDTTPTLYRMATKGIQFLDYYQPAGAGTTGGEYQNTFGMLATDGGASFLDTAWHNNWYSMGWQLNALGYEGWAFHNNEYTYYDRDITHNELGYNHGYMGYGNGMEEYVQWQWPESDLEMVQGTFDHLYGDASPFCVYYMSVSGHSLYDFDSNDMSIKYEDMVKDLPYSGPVKAYLACNIDLDRAMEYLVGKLEEKGIADRTVIVISADHFPYGLDGDGALGNLPYLSELYGYNVTTALQRDHNRLIIWSESLEDEDPIVVDTPTFSIDILPTLLNLFGLDWDSRLLPGRDVFSDRTPLVYDLTYNWRTELGEYLSGPDKFTPREGVTIPDGYVDRINSIVDDKINYMTAVLYSDYMRHVFGDPRDVDEVNAEGKARAGQSGYFEPDEPEVTGDPIIDAVTSAEAYLDGESWSEEDWDYVEWDEESWDYEEWE